MARGSPGKKRTDVNLLDLHHGQSRTGHFAWKAQIKPQEEPLKHWRAPPPTKTHLRVKQGHGLPEFCCRNTGEAMSRLDSGFAHIPVSDDVTYQIHKLRW